MGLLYSFPLHENDENFTKNQEECVLKTYAPPSHITLISLGASAIMSILFLASKHSLNRLGDQFVDQLLYYGVYSTYFFIFAFLIGIHYYQKTIKIKGSKLVITHKIFGIPLKKIQGDLSLGLLIQRQVDSANMAKLQNDPRFKGFENTGYFQLVLDGPNKLLLDRCSQKRDLEKLKKLIEAHA